MNEEANSYRLPLIGDKAPEFTALTTQAVSYTHLDVYKRQL